LSRETWEKCVVVPVKKAGVKEPKKRAKKPVDGRGEVGD